MRGMDGRISPAFSFPSLAERADQKVSVVFEMAKKNDEEIGAS